MDRPVDLIWRCLQRVLSSLLVVALRLIGGVAIDSGVVIRGVPSVCRDRQAKITIGRGVLLNSSSRGYHLNMFSRVKLLADRPGASIVIGEMTRIHGSCVHSQASVSIGRRCLIAANCQIMDASGHETLFEDVTARIHSKDVPRPVVIEDDVWIGTGVVVLPGVRIGRGSVIGANSVVSRDVPEMSIAIGNPAQVVKSYSR
jgi:acetyltransferase-like isoleucine patch superfamily enzyme